MTKKHRLLAAAIAMGSTTLALQAQASQQSESKGFIEDSSLNLLVRSLYWNMDRHAPGASDTNEWGMGAQLAYESGFTQGTVGFGIDLAGYTALKLDSTLSNGGSSVMFPSEISASGNSHAEDDVSSLAAAVKLRISNTVLKYGELRPYNPVFALADARIVPSTATGFQLTSEEIEGLNIDAGHFTDGKDFNRGNHGGFRAGYAGIEGGDVDYLGGTYIINDQWNTTLYASRYEDLWKQYYGNLNYTLPLTDTQSLNFDGNYYHTTDEGQSLAGDIDTDAYSLAATYSIGAHSFTLAYQKVNGDTPFDYLVMNGGGFQDSIYLANSMQIADFNGPGEHSWRATYALDMSAYGIPGLTLAAKYVRGSGVNEVSDGPYGYYAANEKHWERDLEARYVVQSGPAKDLMFRLRQATHRISGTSDVDSDQVRLIVEYPLSIL